MRPICYRLVCQRRTGSVLARRLAFRWDAYSRRVVEHLRSSRWIWRQRHLPLLSALRRDRLLLPADLPGFCIIPVGAFADPLSPPDGCRLGKSQTSWLGACRLIEPEWKGRDRGGASLALAHELFRARPKTSAAPWNCTGAASCQVSAAHVAAGKAPRKPWNSAGNSGPGRLAIAARDVAGP